MSTKTQQLKGINEFIEKFLMENLDSEDHGNLMTVWNSQDIQNGLKEIIPSPEKKLKDPNKPKRGKSAYLFFCEDKREEAKTQLENGGGAFTTKDVTSRLGLMWNELKSDPKSKKKLEGYEKKARDAKAEYEREIADYVPPTDEELEAVKKVKKLKDPNAPKRGKSTYLFFCEEERPKVKADLGDGAKSSEVTSELGVRWQDLVGNASREATKRINKYKEMAATDKERYEREKAEYAPPSEEELKEMGDKKKGGKKETVVKKTPPRKVSAYALFCKEMRPGLKEEHSEASGGEITKMLATLWQDLEDETKEEWRTRASGDD